MVDVQTNINIYNNNICILDSIATTKTRDSCLSERSLFLKCVDCGSVFSVKVGCNSRSCAFCQAKRRKLLFNKYSRLVSNWNNGFNGLYIQFLTLTFKNVMDIEVYEKSRKMVGSMRSGWVQDVKLKSRYIERCDLHLKAFIKRLSRKNFVFDYGFINKEMTWSQDNGYHYHYHILFYGKLLDRLEVSNMWRDVTKDSYIIDLKIISDFNDNSHALHYLLKYVAKVENSNIGLDMYYRCTKGSRYFNTFGKRYGKLLNSVKDKVICQDCGSRVVLIKNSDHSVELDFNKVNKQRIINKRKELFIKEFYSQINLMGIFPTI